MILLLFGPPGSGKGTQSRLLVQRLAIPAISTGDMLRAESAAGTDLGRQVEHVLKAGGLVGDDLVNHILVRRIRQDDCRNGFLLDGYPRTVPQAEYFDRILAEDEVLSARNLGLPRVLYLNVSERVLIDRISARRQCPVCGRIYNVALQPPRVPGRCDDDAAELTRRADDNPQVVSQRLRAYASFTAPILDHYASGEVHLVEAMRPPNEVFAEILGILGLEEAHSARPVGS